MSYSALLNVMVSAVLKAGKLLSRDFGEVQNLQASLKGPHDFVTRSRLKCQEIIYQELLCARPKYGFYSGGKVCDGEDNTARWIVDPLNGFTNFLYAIPHFCVSIALERNQEIVASVVFNPITDELFTAERGAGSFLNDRRIRVSSRKNLPQSIVCYSSLRVDEKQTSDYFTQLYRIMNYVVGTRSFGSEALDLSYIAAGRFDGFWGYGLPIWCISAGLLIVRESGGFSTGLLGENVVAKTKGVVSGNMHVHKKLLDILKS
ncbi:inositol monophosphatase family protein [Candidatus Liberibacter africanus]|uniref:Inositol-1-monophosphatase n=1 Tax=Candidatus Liberibacter africanus PTSAPSY TaxID=1277257 RepID=A0A0G3I5D2_LIBAF|nr:inositol monophosphatase family protein [Candidatus Liberibacter africanus]AKK20445.1 putative inositol-1-monophosphatase [Candidatus Liberibacter africanus PTSAPSY]